MDFTGQVVIVTGAASGFGTATATRYAELGAKVEVPTSIPPDLPKSSRR